MKGTPKDFENLALVEELINSVSVSLIELSQALGLDSSLVQQGAAGN